MTRVVVAIILGIVVGAVIWFLPTQLFRWVVAVVAGAGLFEISRMRFADRIERWTVVICGLLVALIILFDLPHPLWVLSLVGALFICALIIMWRTREMEGTADRVGYASMALIYVGVSMPFWALLHGMEKGRWLVFLAIVPACLCDTFAFLVGKLVGRHKLAPMVSPNKTVEGFFGALIGSVVGTAVVVFLGFKGMPAWQIALVIFSVWLVSPMGDLVESMIKRSAGVKDSGTILKGHGGVLDRLDALIFVGPMMYVFAKYIF